MCLVGRQSQCTPSAYSSQRIGRLASSAHSASGIATVSLDLLLVRTYEVADPWSALADGTRRAIFKRLAAGPRAVGELATGLPVSRPAVSQHLKVLKCAGLVQDRAVGTRRVYQLDPKGVEALRAELDVFWDRALDAYQLLVDEEGRRA
jgi:DNA-binding transcriptional ArsR family regulator